MKKIKERRIMTESCLKKQALKNGLGTGEKVRIHYCERARGIVLHKTRIGTVTALYPYHFIVRYKNGATESYQYHEFVHKRKDLMLCIC